MTNSKVHLFAASQGFAYLWTLLLVALLGLGLTKGAEVYATSVQRDREVDLMFAGRQMRNAIGRYYESQLQGGRREYPAKLNDLLKDNRYPELRRYLRKIYRDPITGTTEWGLVQVRGRIAGVYSISEARPLKQENFEPAERSFQGKERYDEWKFTYPPDLMLQQQAQAGGKMPAASAEPEPSSTQSPMQSLDSSQ